MTNIGKVKRLELNWQLHVTPMPGRDARNISIQAMTNFVHQFVHYFSFIIVTVNMIHIRVRIA